MDCLFCKITKGEIPSEKIYEDANSYSFLDIQPNNPGHTLLVPKTHARNIFDIPHGVLCDLMEPLQKVSRAVKRGVGADGVNIAMNNEPSAGQIVFHVHFHIIPRFEGDDTKHKNLSAAEMKKIAQKIKSELN